MTDNDSCIYGPKSMQQSIVLLFRDKLNSMNVICARNTSKQMIAFFQNTYNYTLPLEQGRTLNFEWYMVHGILPFICRPTAEGRSFSIKPLLWQISANKWTSYSHHSNINCEANVFQRPKEHIFLVRVFVKVARRPGVPEHILLLKVAGNVRISFRQLSVLNNVFRVLSWFFSFY